MFLPCHLKVKRVFVLGCYDLQLYLLSKCVVNSQYQISLNLSSMKQEGMFSHALVLLCGIGKISATWSAAWVECNSFSCLCSHYRWLFYSDMTIVADCIICWSFNWLFWRTFQWCRFPRVAHEPGSWQLPNDSAVGSDWTEVACPFASSRCADSSSRGCINGVFDVLHTLSTGLSKPWSVT